MAPLDRIVDALNQRFPQSTSPTWPLALARILLGVMWLTSLRWKLPPDFEADGHTSLRGWLDLMVEHAAFGFYGDLIDSVVVPQFTLFAWLLFVTELFVGLALLLGIFVRPAALVGLAMSLNLLVGLLDVPGEWPWSYLLLAMWHGAVLVSAAGAYWTVLPKGKPS